MTRDQAKVIAGMARNGWVPAKTIEKHYSLYSEGVKMRKGVLGGPEYYQRPMPNSPNEIEYAAVWPDGTVRRARPIRM